MRVLLLVFMFSLSCWAQSQDAPKNVPPVADKAEGADTTKAESERQNSIPAPPVNVLVSNSANSHPQDEKQSTKHEPTSFAEWLIAVATMVFAGVTWGLVHYTKKLWRSTSEVVLETRQSSERQLRAYVFAGHDSPMFLTKGRALSVEIAIKNFGQTPANEVMTYAFIGVLPYPLTAPIDPPDYTNASKSPMAPSQVIKQFPTLPAPLDNPQLNAILARQAAVYVWGAIVYADIFNIPRRTRFCLYSTGEDIGNGELAYYPDGNDAD